VASVSAGAEHGPRKPAREAITLLAGLGVEGDAHLGATVQHRSRAKAHPEQANLRQVHLVHAELLDDLAGQGLHVDPGAMGENVLTVGVDLLGLPVGTVLHLGPDARVELTGLRNPCWQLDGVVDGLMAATLGRDSSGALVRKAGVMGVVLTGGVVRPGDVIAVSLPATSEPLQPV
jgi:MOSC domain-containing protein YiiM